MLERQIKNVYLDDLLCLVIKNKPFILFCSRLFVNLRRKNVTPINNEYIY